MSALPFDLKRFTVTLNQANSEPATMTVCARTASQAVNKAYHAWTASLPFWSFKQSDIKAKLACIPPEIPSMRRLLASLQQQ